MHHSRPTFVPTLAFAAAFLLVPASLCAQESIGAAPSQVSVREGSIRLGAELVVLGHQDRSATVEIGAGGASLDVDRSVTTVGLSQLGGIGPIVGYALREDLLLTARVLLNYTADLGFEQAQVSLVPELEWLMRDVDDTWVPHLGGGLGLWWQSLPTGTSTATDFGVALGGRAGVHGFLAPGASIDVSLSLLALVGSMSLDVPDASGTSLGYAATISVGTSCWL